jgi:DNA primase
MPPTRTAPPLRAQTATAQASKPVIEVNGQEFHFTIGTRRYRVRGLEKNLSGQQLRVNLLAARDELVHLDTLDLCQARSRAAFVKAAATELFVEEETIKRDVGRLLLELEQLQQEQIEAATATREAKVELTEAETQEALELLRDPKLVDRILADYETCGLVGEATNKLVCYLACVSRRLNQPLAVLIQSGSAAGKTSLMDATLHFMPPEDQLRYSAMTGQSLYYMGRQDLKHKILAVAEEEGVAQASYALKLLQSDGRLRIAAAGKNSGTGRQETESYEIEGPVMMFLTTTAEEPDLELQNRCLVLQVDESPQQTEAIHARQRAAYTLAGHLAEDRRQQIGRLHQNAQRLLEPLPVTIPWAEKLRFRYDQTRMRRDHAKYLALIASITLLHQHQRPRQTRQVGEEEVAYLEASPEDVLLANRLISQVMGQTLDALLPQTRQLLVLVDDHVSQRSQAESKPRHLVRFTQRELREALGWGDFPVRRHLARLVELEYVLAHRTGHGNQRHYELLYDGQGRRGEPFLLGLADATSLSAAPQEVRNDHLEGRNDAHSMPIRSASDAHSMPGKKRRKS